jgi:hypothetical protein
LRLIRARHALICERLHTKSDKEDAPVTMLWFFVWLIWNLVGDEEPLLFDPVNFWTGALIFCIAVDLARQHAEGAMKS